MPKYGVDQPPVVAHGRAAFQPGVHVCMDDAAACNGWMDVCVNAHGGVRVRVNGIVVRIAIDPL